MALDGTPVKPKGGRPPNPQRTFIDQYGQVVRARTTKDLVRRAGGGRIGKMYVDITARGCKHIGYVVGARWFTEYQIRERPA